MKVKVKCGSTTNMWTHLSVNHLNMYGKLKHLKTRNKLITSSTSSTGSTSTSMSSTQRTIQSFSRYESHSERHKAITRTIMRYMCLDLLPLQTVEKRGFKELIATLDNRYKLPSRSHFRKIELPKLYQEVKNYGVFISTGEVSF